MPIFERLIAVRRFLTPRGWLIVAVLFLIMVIFGLYLLGERERDAARAVGAKIETSRTGALIESAKEAAAINDAARDAADDNEAKAREAEHAIQNAPGADLRLDPALNRTGRRGLCNSPSYADSPACAVQQPGRADPPRERPAR